MHIMTPIQLWSPVCLASEYFYFCLLSRSLFSLLFFYDQNVIDFSSFSLCVDCRFVTTCPLPLANQIFLLLHLLHSSSNNNHTHLIITRLSMIDGFDHWRIVDSWRYMYSSWDHFVVLIRFIQSLSLNFRSLYFTSLLS